MASNTIRETLERNGVEIEHCSTILDFGCGVGRIMRHWKALQRPALHGTDYNTRLVEWCRQNLSFAEFKVNALSDKLSYEPETFDFIYAFSVFTHLSEPLQLFWMNELSRVLRPGGYIYFTTHGDYFLPQLSAEEKEKFLSGQLVVRAAEESGSNLCATYHPVAYVRGKLAREFSIVDFIPGSAEGDLLHDIYLGKKPARAVQRVTDRRNRGECLTNNARRNADQLALHSSGVSLNGLLEWALNRGQLTPGVHLQACQRFGFR